MEASLLTEEFAPLTTYLNTASHGLPPLRTATAVRTVVDGMTAGHIDMVGYFARVDATRAAFARIAGTTADRVAVGTAVSTHIGMVAASLPSGAEVVVADDDFSSVVNPFTVRDDLKLRSVPLESLAEAVGPATTLVAVSAVQSADGRIADLAAVRAATRAAGARMLVDATQATGWLPYRADDFDYVVCGAYKWLLCPRGTSFLVVSQEAQDAGALTPVHAGWVAGERPWSDCYGPIARLAPDARRYDESVPFLPYLGAEASLSLIEEIGAETVGAHDRALAARFRTGVARLGSGYEPVPGDSAIVAVPGMDGAADALARAGIVASARNGNLRVAFHLYNTEADVDRLLDALESAVR